MAIRSRWLAPVVLATALGALAPVTVRAQDDVLARVLVDIADVVFNNGVPYYRYGDYGYDDRLVVGRDRYGRPVYYRQVGYDGDHAAHGYDGYGAYGAHVGPYGDVRPYGNVKCNKHGKCKQTYYDDRYDHDGDHWGRGDHEDDDDDD